MAFADDVCLIAESTHELQAMLDIAAKYASDWEYGYNASKSVYMTFSNQDTQTPSEEQLLLGNNPVENQQEHTYLGITFRERNQIRNEDVTNKSMLARRTLYSLTGAGTHAQGIPPIVSTSLWNTYALPHMLYGVEANNISRSQQLELDKHQNIILKQILGLPQQAANVAAKVLVGARSIQYRIMESRINIFCKIASMDPDFIETRLLYSVLGTTRCKRWCFTDVQRDLEELNLPSVDYIILHPMKSTVWKKVAKLAVMHLENDSNQTDIHQKSTLSMLLGLKADVTTPILRPYKQVSPYQRFAITTKARMLSGVYPVRTRLRQINQNVVDTVCRFCSQEDEDIIHFLGSCPEFQTIRNEYR